MTIGQTLGRAIGKSGALIVEGGVRGATGLGRFGADVVAGAEAGYAEKRTELLASRAVATANRDAAKAKYLAALEAPSSPLPQKAAKLTVKAS